MERRLSQILRGKLFLAMPQGIKSVRLDQYGNWYLWFILLSEDISFESQGMFA